MKTPELLNEDPYGKGGFIKSNPQNGLQKRFLLSG